MEVDEDQLQQLMASGNQVLKKGEMASMDPEQLKAMQNQGPSAKDISQGMQQGFAAIKDMRADADVAKRIEIAESCKTDANEKLAAGVPSVALKAYLVGIWLLMRGDPEPTRSLVAPVATERDAKIALGAGADGTTDAEAFGESYAQQIRELRTALHLNVAAATLKLNMFAVASLACRVVLEERPEHPKALFRLAKAGEGTGDLGGAIATLSKLLKVEGQADNIEARKLLQTLRTRKTREAKIYGGFFEKAREDGGSLYADADKGADNAKTPDLKKGSEQQDDRKMKDILKNRLPRLPLNVQKELRQMGKVGLSPTEFMKAYRRFLKDELKRMARDTVPEELSEIMSVMQAPDEKMEAVIDKVKALIEVRKLQPWRFGAGRWCYQGRAPAVDARASASELPASASCPSSAWKVSCGRWRYGDHAEMEQDDHSAKVDELLSQPFDEALRLLPALRQHISSQDDPAEVMEAFSEAWSPDAPDEVRQILEELLELVAAGGTAAATEVGEKMRTQAAEEAAKAPEESKKKEKDSCRGGERAAEPSRLLKEAVKKAAEEAKQSSKDEARLKVESAPAAQKLEQCSREGSPLMKFAKLCNICGR